MKVLLTGADGFLGSHILRRLLDANHSVRAFLQKNRDHKTIAGLKYEAFYGDLLNDNDIESALSDCDAVIHTVALTDIWPSRNPLIWEINYEVIKKLSAMVLEHKINRLIYIGTANSFGFGSKTSPGTELSPFSSGKYALDYIDSKKAAQDYLLEEHKKNGLPVIIINPSFMLGEYDSKPGSGAMILSIINRTLPACAHGGRCFAYANDVAVASVNALSKGRLGECYITGGANLSYREFFNLVSSISGVTPPKYCVPYSFLYSFAWLLESVGSISKSPPRLTRPIVKISRDGNYYSSEKAIDELDMPQTNIRTAVTRTIDWFRENGYCQ